VALNNLGECSMNLWPHRFTGGKISDARMYLFFLYQSEFPVSHEQGSVYNNDASPTNPTGFYPSLKLFISNSLHVDEISTIIACAPVIQNLQKSEYPSCRQATLASATPHESSHTVPQA